MQAKTLRFRCSVFLVFAAFLASASYAQTVPPDLRDAIAKIDTMTQQELAKDNVGGVTIGVVSGGNLVWTKSYGFADMEKKVPAARESVYRIGSITKQFTALMFLQLIHDRKVRLSDPVEKHFPELSRVQGRIADAPPITLVQLATMTSGLSREPEDLPTYLKGPVSDWEKVMISALPKVKYEFEPDTRYSYSNIGYAILGAALARAAGQSFTQYIQQRIFTPLEMTTTAFEPNDRIRMHLTKGYAVNQGGKVDGETPAREHDGRGYKVPNGAMYTTVGDLAKFVAFELGDGPASVLPKEAWLENLTRVNSSNGSLSSGYGVGFQLARRGNMIAIGHGGSVAGYNAAAQFDPASRTGVIVLRNVGGGAFQVGNLCMRALAELHAARPRPAGNSGGSR